LIDNSYALTFPPLESVESGVGSPTNEWILVGVLGSHELATPERLKQLEKMKQSKTDHGEANLAADVISVGHPKLFPFLQITLTAQDRYRYTQ